MRMTYDPRRSVVCIRLRPGGWEVESVRVSDEITIDLTPDGAVSGVELMNANEQLRASDERRVIVKDEADGREMTFPLTAA